MDAQEQPDSEDTIQGAHHVSLDEVTEDGQKESAPVGSGGDSSSDSSVEVVGVSVPDAPVQASVGGAAVVECPAEDVLVKPQPDEDVISVDDDVGIPDETPMIKLEGRLSTVKEEVVLEDSQETSHLKPETSLPSDLQVLKPSFTSTPEVQSPSRSRMEIDLTVNEDPVEREAPFSVDQGKTYMADQVRRWEQVTLEFVMSPTIEYTWPHPNPDFKSWYAAVVRTSEYAECRWLAGRKRGFPNGASLAPNAVVDFTSVEVYLKDLSPRECVAVLQTMFFDVGFRFRNLIPEWFRAHASQVDRSLVRAVAEDLQHLLTMELLEWREVTSGVPSPMLSPLDVRALTDTVEDMKPEDAEGDSLMPSYEAGLLGSECVERLKKAGVRVTRSPAILDTDQRCLDRPPLDPKSPTSADPWSRSRPGRCRLPHHSGLWEEQRRLTCRTLSLPHPEWFSLLKAALRKSTGTWVSK
ncbi:LOW QUALITY PROTEIN: Hypothetical protein PHPALM_19179 [Phytophthora palmivora]|uniref:Uncharacterized protein n=1 Tax=Phytophthora palmivora TaxID=4796 RepID=A0A2P4XHX7_9STRA|nr:LOW QUALITY PROTEIN: Hypothetical protein PHPALM_19179 [Phytophthora palmivora]